MPLSAVIFDFDGVIANTEALHLLAFQLLYRRRGFDLGSERYHAEYLAFDDRGVFVHHHEHLGLPLDEAEAGRLIEEKAALFAEAAAAAPVEAFPGFLPLFEACCARMPVAVCTSAARADVEPLLRRFGVLDKLAALTAIEDVPASKPDPAGYRLTVHRLADRIPALFPREVVAIEDSPGGLAAARGAGLRTLGVAHTCPASRLTAADRVVQDLTRVDLPLLESLVDSPPS